MKRKIFYIYNPNTLSYERVYPSFRKKIFTVLRHLIIGIIIGFLIFTIFNYFIDSPQERLLKQENQTIKAQYKLLSRRLDEALKVMSDIQQRDDNLYRVILQAEPINAAVRNAGLNNEAQYKELMKLSDAELIVSTTRKVDLLTRQLYVQSNSIDELVKLGQQQEDRLKSIPAIQPISNKDLKKTASGYGLRIDPIYNTRKFHAGMDFASDIGTPVYATGNGTIIETGWKQGYGNTILIDHGYDYKTRYAHLSAIKVKNGQKVSRGEEIGLVGNTGKSTGPHLHYEVLYKGKHDNPINYYFFDLSPQDYDKMIQIASNQGRVMD
ncbi:MULTISPECIES: M23 family metallopeptidase [Bacteroidales]|jgi:peptidase|uniref:M23 family metallopeptidase n=1 Tax=Bacteroidales TaxID=171549 RepID=UPI000575089E|nr:MULTISPECIES: M23 family metallopeptidase [Bacteroidales]KHM44990.1 peptidase M23 [Coprobacter secundus]